MDASQVILVLVVVAGVNALVWGLLIFLLSSRSRKLSQDLANSGESVLMGPVRGLLQTMRGVVSLRTGGVVALTERRIVFLKPLGGELEIPLSAIKNVTTSTWFAGNYRGGREWLIIERLDGSKMAFMVSNAGIWACAMQARIAD